MVEYEVTGPESWPREGWRKALRRHADGHLEYEYEFRHIDADGPRIERRDMEPAEAAAWLRAQEAPFARVEEFLPGALEAAESLAGEEAPPEVNGKPRVWVRRLAPGVYFREDRYRTDEREVSTEELMLKWDFPWIGNAVGWVKDKAYELEGEHPVRAEVHRRWLSVDEVREALQEAGVPPERLEELIPEVRESGEV